jgi:hypothetical protein
MKDEIGINTFLDHMRENWALMKCLHKTFTLIIRSQFFSQGVSVEWIQNSAMMQGQNR